MQARIAECYEFEEFVEIQLMLAANEQNATCYSHAPTGRLVAEPAAVVSALEGSGYHVLRNDEDHKHFVLVHDRGFVEVDAKSPTPLAAYTLDKQEIGRLRERFGEWVQRRAIEDPGAFYMLQWRHRCLEFTPTGHAGKPLQRENYARPVLAGFDHAVADLASDDPCGRLVLMSGPPGTGKTYLVRGLLAAAERPKFVLVQASDLKQLVDAEALATLCDFARDEAKGCPIVFVIEDADACLLPRGSDNLSQLSVLLNMSDGLIGAALDLRVVATTNARQIDIDPAIVRPGRICRRIDVAPLDAEDAQRVLFGLVGRRPSFTFGKAATLAEVYAKAREEAQT